MTEPDEALLRARKDFASLFMQYSPDVSERILNGFWDDHESIVRRVTSHRAAASAERIKELERALINTSASLLAAISLLENGGKKAAPSDKMFKIMLSDYRAAADRAAALLKDPDL